MNPDPAVFLHADPGEQGYGSGSAWIRIYFPSWIRIRIQEGKFVN